eukprot:2263009-Rhodomonas_salina.1
MSASAAALAPPHGAPAGSTKCCLRLTAARLPSASSGPSAGPRKETNFGTLVPARAFGSGTNRPDQRLPPTQVRVRVRQPSKSGGGTRGRLFHLPVHVHWCTQVYTACTRTRATSISGFIRRSVNWSYWMANP